MNVHLLFKNNYNTIDSIMFGYSVMIYQYFLYSFTHHLLITHLMNRLDLDVLIQKYCTSLLKFVVSSIVIIIISLIFSFIFIFINNVMMFILIIFLLIFVTEIYLFKGPTRVKFLINKKKIYK